MIRNYRKRPVVIQAIQYTKETCEEIHSWAGLEPHVYRDYVCGVEPILIPTLEGVMEASPGDFIIRGVNGEFYPCKPDIFYKTYEDAEEGVEG